MKLALGTVQFGLAYGITNASGQVSESTARAILLRAKDAGVQVLDTAAAYGESETVLGRAHNETRGFRIVSKTLPLSAADDNDPVGQVVSRARESLTRLRVTQLDGLLVHHAGDLLGAQGEALYSALQTLRSEGAIARLGVSVYTPEEARTIARRFAVDLIQVPINVLDQSFATTGTLAWLHERDIEVHTRSAFLQGLLMADVLPAFLKSLAPGFERFREICRDASLSPLEGALSYLRTLPIDHVVIGVQSVAQLSEIVSAWQRVQTLNVDGFVDCDMATSPAVNPANWARMSKESS